MLAAVTLSPAGSTGRRAGFRQERARLSAGGQACANGWRVRGPRPGPDVLILDLEREGSVITLSTALDITLRTTAVYAVILLGLRLSGKREIGQITVFDLVVLLLLANAVQNAMVGPDTSLAGGVLAAIVLLALSAIVIRARLRWPQLRRVLEGAPTLLVLHGQPIPEHLRREGLDEDALEAALREHGIARLRDVEMAVLEVDGSISVVPTGAETKRVRHRLKQLRPG
jgi:uncharacterized membrane protein YcaP (DUF421 family)